MPTTTSYGNWVNIEKHSVSVEDTVASALGDYVDDYDLEALVRDYREAINEAHRTSLRSRLRLWRL
jgi:hypothetical protein